MITVPNEHVYLCGGDGMLTAEAQAELVAFAARLRAKKRTTLPRPAQLPPRHIVAWFDTAAPTEQRAFAEYARVSYRHVRYWLTGVRPSRRLVSEFAAFVSFVAAGGTP